MRRKNQNCDGDGAVITLEERERFIAIWKDKIPNEVNWTDEDIELAMLHGA